MIIKRITDSLLNGQLVDSNEFIKAIQNTICGRATPAQISALFTALLAKGISRSDFANIEKAVKNSKSMQYIAEKKVDYYLYSFAHSNFVILLCLLLMEFNKSAYAKFKKKPSVIVDQKNDFDSLDVGNKEEIELLEKFNLSISFSNYSNILKNIIFIKNELGYSSIYNLIKLSMNPIDHKHKIFVINDTDLSLFQKIDNNIWNLFSEAYVFIIYEGQLKFLEIKNNSIYQEEIFYLNNFRIIDSKLIPLAIKQDNFFEIIYRILGKILHNTELPRFDLEFEKNLKSKIMVHYSQFFQEYNKNAD
ncbi:MAG: hypothetical protein ACI8ZF_000781 [Candidatus Midichloriaceae bacterium]|jgi:hypothetical protein